MKIMNVCKHIAYDILGILIIFLPIFIACTPIAGMGNYCILSFAALAYLLIIATATSKVYHITILDILLLCFLMWIIIDSFWINERVMSNEKVILIFASSIIYLVCKRMNFSKHQLSVILMLGGIIQSLVAWGQYWDLLDSNHLIFEVTGSFANPAPLSVYIGLSLIATAYLSYTYYQCSKYRLCVVLSLLTLPMIGIIIISYSRASWVALLGVLLFMLWKYRIFKNKAYGIACLIVCVSLLPFIYQLKKESADGRLFIWNVSKELIKSAPIQGRGGGGFAAEYMLAQANYFKQYPDSEYKMKATDNIYAFNEFLRIVCEYGIIGLLFTGIILYVSLKRQEDIVTKSMLFYFCVFACFSYIEEVPILVILCSIFMGKLSNSTFILYTFRYKKPWLIAVCPFVMTIFSSVSYHQEKQLFNLLSLYAETNEQVVKQQLMEKYSSNKYHHTFILKCAHQLYRSGSYTESLTYLQQAFLLSPVSDISMDLGNCYYSLGKYEEAEYYIEKARWMVPSHILPQYYLFRIYIKQGYTKKACLYGKAILLQEFKKEGSVAMEVKHYIQEYLNKQSGYLFE